MNELEIWKEQNRPCGEAVGSQIGQLMIAAYPRFKAHSPAEYAKLVSSALGEFPKDVAMQAMQNMIRTLKFPPTVADIFEACEDIMTARRKDYAEQRRQHDERRQWAKQQERERKAREDREALKQTLGDAWEPWWGIPLTRRYTGTPEAFAKGYAEARDKEAFVASWGMIAGEVRG